MSASNGDPNAPGSGPDRTRRRVILDTRVRVRQMQLQVPFSFVWHEQLDTVIKPIVRVALAEEASSNVAGASTGTVFPRVAWIPAVAPTRVRPTPAEALIPVHDPAHAHRESAFTASQQQQTASPSGSFAPQSPSSNDSGNGSVPLARRPSMSNVSGTSLCTVGVVADASTVWERGEIVARVVIEEGKTATVLRSYTDFVNYVATNGLPNPAAVVSGGENLNWAYESAHFLVNACFLLRDVLHTVEAAQTVDGFDFLQHAVTVFSPYRHGAGGGAGVPAPNLGPASNPLPGDIADLLQSQGIVLVSVFFQWLDKLSNVDQLLERVVEENFVGTLLNYGERQQLHLTPSASLFALDPAMRAAYIRLFLQLVSSEAFQIRRDKIFSVKPMKDQFARVLDSVVKAHFGQSLTVPEVKRELRPLLDVILRYK